VKQKNEGVQTMKFKNVCSTCEEKLEKDIGRLQDKIGEALDYYLELRQMYGELPGWEMVEDKLCLAIGWADTPLEPILEEGE
jgi:hypothetical protein